MSRFGEHLPGLVLAWEADDPMSVFREEVEDRLTQANDDVLRLAGDQLPADQLPSFFFAFASTRNVWAFSLAFRDSRYSRFSEGSSSRADLKRGFDPLTPSTASAETKMFGAQIKGLSVVETKFDSGLLRITQEG